MTKHVSFVGNFSYWLLYTLNAVVTTFYSCIQFLHYLLSVIINPLLWQLNPLSVTVFNNNVIIFALKTFLFMLLVDETKCELYFYLLIELYLCFSESFSHLVKNKIIINRTKYIYAWLVALFKIDFSTGRLPIGLYTLSWMPAYNWLNILSLLYSLVIWNGILLLIIEST